MTRYSGAWWRVVIKHFTHRRSGGSTFMISTATRADYTMRPCTLAGARGSTGRKRNSAALPNLGQILWMQLVTAQPTMTSVDSLEENLSGAKVAQLGILFCKQIDLQRVQGTCSHP